MTLAEAMQAFVAATSRPFRKAIYLLTGYLLPREITSASDMSDAEWDRAEAFGMNLPEVNS